MKIYMDNASTTRLDDEVINDMNYSLKNIYGNPSSLHSFGREAKSKIEKVRKNIAKILNTKSERIIFTSGGTESNNWIINKSIESLGIKNIITSKLEHSAILKPLEYLEKINKIKISYVNFNNLGDIEFDDLENKLRNNNNSLVLLMHGNNEIGNITDINKVAELCDKYNAIFHSDTIQTMGFINYNLEKLNLHFCICSAHKIHGPKGIGLLYINEKLKINPYIDGGGQEFGLRGGTENVHGIIGLGKAFEIAYKDFDYNKNKLSSLKSIFLTKLTKEIHNIRFNGNCLNLNKSLDKIINIKIPTKVPTDMLILKLDMQGIAVSAGSACSSGTIQGSHVIDALDIKNNIDGSFANIRISLSKFNTEQEIDKFLSVLKKCI